MHQPRHLTKLRHLGFNVLRLPVVWDWEALEHASPRIYDEAYMAHIKKPALVCSEYAFKVPVNPHQDLWPRSAGGSGTPLWTLHECGLGPDGFAETQAAIRYPELPLGSKGRELKRTPGMMWTTNQNRLAASALFALFFGGRD